MDVELKSCPWCGKAPKPPREIVEGKVWSMGCEGHLRHSAGAMSWVSAEDCIAQWNTRHGAGDAEAWRGIESAPHTGIAVLLWQPWKSGRDCTTIGHYANGWCDRFNEEMTPEPTHWRPLPAPPNDDAARAGERG